MLRAGRGGSIQASQFCVRVFGDEKKYIKNQQKWDEFWIHNMAWSGSIVCHVPKTYVKLCECAYGKHQFHSSFGSNNSYNNNSQHFNAELTHRIYLYWNS